MKFTPAEPGLVCWRLAHTFSDFYPPEESVQSCLDGLDQTNESAIRHEEWYHEQKCEVYQEVIEHLYDAGVEVWDEGQDHVQTGPHPESAKPDLALPRRPPVIDAVPGEDSATTTEALQSTIDLAEDRLLAASNIDDQLMWVDVLSDLTNTSQSDIGAWLREIGKQATKRKT